MHSVKIVIRKKKLKDGKYPVMLRITKNRRTKLLHMGLRTWKNDFNEDKGEFLRSYPNYRKRNIFLANQKLYAEKIIDDFLEKGKVFTVEDIASAMADGDNSEIDVWTFFKQRVDHLQRSDKMGTAKAYEETNAALKKFHSGSLNFKDVNVQFLERFELYMRNRGNQEGGIAFKMRHLRAVYNEAILKDVVEQNFYPFKKYRISKLKRKENKIALSISELKAFENADLSENPHLIESHHYFVFSFYCRGMNFADMAFLKWSDVRNNKITYSRQKTQKLFVIEILPPVEKILKYFKEQKSTSPYVFPIFLKEGMSAKQIANRRHKVLSRYNRRLNEIASLVGLDRRISSYVARHSYATIMMHKGASVEVISEALGHSNVQITTSYLKRFDNKRIDNEHKKLLDL
ncbi:phage integrase SAM-like domain-containing protein [Salinimicrobium sp. GXAS 041]|uniref:phage integrase SAM-like domain-containing protein n=1 Tax=Salinimicrobium sp. GXAS 041 TaxID=3400806 RepID=UPI003C740735